MSWKNDGGDRPGGSASASRGPATGTGAEMVANATASWEPFGLPEPGMVHLGGKVVADGVGPARRPATAVRQGWYTIAEAITILSQAALAGCCRRRRRAWGQKAAEQEGRRAASAALCPVMWRNSSCPITATQEEVIRHLVDEDGEMVESGAGAGPRCCQRNRRRRAPRYTLPVVKIE